MSVAQVQAPGQDKLKFEVTNKLEKSFPSFWLKGNRTSLGIQLHATFSNALLLGDDRSRRSSTLGRRPPPKH